MSVLQRINSGLWPTTDPLLGIVKNGLVCAMDAHNGNFNNLHATPADGSAQSVYNWTGLSVPFTSRNPSRVEMIPGNSNDALSCNGGANTAFLNSVHQDNALFSIMAVGRVSSVQGMHLVLAGSTIDNQWGNGIQYMVNGSYGAPSLSITNGGGVVYGAESTLTVPRDAPFFIGLSLNEAAASGMFYINGSYTTFAPTYSSPSTGGAAASFRIGARGSGNIYAMTTEQRVGQYAMWNRALSVSEWDSMFAVIRTRWGI